MSVSFVVAAYNIEAYIAECLDRLLPCVRPQDEVIVVNDGSTDRTPETLRAKLSGLPNAQIVDKPNGGLSSARNAGLARATGTYVLFVDGDDAVIEETVKASLALLDHHSPDILVTDYLFWLNDGQGPTMPSPPRRHLPHQVQTDTLQNLTEYFQDGIPCVWSRFFRRQLFDGMGTTPFPEWSMYDDMPTTPYLVARAASIYYFPQAMVLYRTRPGSLTRLRSERTCTDMVRGALRAIQAGQTLDASPDLRLAKWLYFAGKFAEAVQQGREVVNPNYRFYLSLEEPLFQAASLLSPPSPYTHDGIVSSSHRKALKHAALARRWPRSYALINAVLAQHKHRRATGATNVAG